MDSNMAKVLSREFENPKEAIKALKMSKLPLCVSVQGGVSVEDVMDGDSRKDFIEYIVKSEVEWKNQLIFTAKMMVNSYE